MTYMRRKNDSMKRVAIVAGSSIGDKEKFVVTTSSNALMALSILLKTAQTTIFVSLNLLYQRMSTQLFIAER